MEILDQIAGSKLSKQGRTNPSGIFEGTPSNVGVVVRGFTVPQTSTEAPPIQDPIDVTFNAAPQQTYLGYLKESQSK